MRETIVLNAQVSNHKETSQTTIAYSQQKTGKITDCLQDERPEQGSGAVTENLRIRTLEGRPDKTTKLERKKSWRNKGPQSGIQRSEWSMAIMRDPKGSNSIICF